MSSSLRGREGSIPSPGSPTPERGSHRREEPLGEDPTELMSVNPDHKLGNCSLSTDNKTPGH